MFKCEKKNVYSNKQIKNVSYLNEYESIVNLLWHILILNTFWNKLHQMCASELFFLKFNFSLRQYFYGGSVSRQIHLFLALHYAPKKKQCFTIFQGRSQEICITQYQMLRTLMALWSKRHTLKKKSGWASGTLQTYKPKTPSRYGPALFRNKIQLQNCSEILKFKKKSLCCTQKQNLCNKKLKFRENN